jgi:hypothetical protein
VSNKTFGIIRGRIERSTVRVPCISNNLYSFHSKSRRYHALSLPEVDLEINELLATLSEAEKSNESVAHALDVREALASRNYHRLFRLYNLAPNMGGYLMDFFVERERVAACCIICKAYNHHFLKSMC